MVVRCQSWLEPRHLLCATVPLLAVASSPRRRCRVHPAPALVCYGPGTSRGPSRLKTQTSSSITLLLLLNDRRRKFSLCGAATSLLSTPLLFQHGARLASPAASSAAQPARPGAWLVGRGSEPSLSCSDQHAAAVSLLSLYLGVRWNSKIAQFVRLLAHSRARSVPPPLRSSATTLSFFTGQHFFLQPLRPSQPASSLLSLSPGQRRQR